MLVELLQAFALVFIAEMGDKSQIIAMAFATKYKIKYVILGIFVGSFLNHSLAVLLGSNLSLLIDLNTLTIIAGFSFVLFGLWSLKFDDEEEGTKISKYGPVVTVAIAFFIGELGDKTQLTAIALSTDATYPLLILTGTVFGMVSAGIIGIFVGIKVGNRIDEFYIKLGTSVIFLVFGTIKLYSSLPSMYFEPLYIILYSSVIIASVYILLLPTVKLRQVGRRTAYQQAAIKLHNFYNDMYENISGLCLGENHCGKCGGNNCLVGYTRNILLHAKVNKEFDIDFIEQNALKKDFDRAKVLESLMITINYLQDDWKSKDVDKVHKIRMNLEFIMYKQTIEANTFIEYKSKLQIIDKKLFDLLEQ